MVGFLALIAFLSYAFAVFCFFIGISANGSDIQLILSALSATCGTVALAGIGVIQQIENLRIRLTGEQKYGPSGEVIQ